MTPGELRDAPSGDPEFAAVVTPTCLIITAQAIDPGHLYDVRLSEREPSGTLRPLAAAPTHARSAPSALVGFLQRERSAGMLEPTIGAELALAIRSARVAIVWLDTGPSPRPTP